MLHRTEGKKGSGKRNGRISGRTLRELSHKRSECGFSKSSDDRSFKGGSD
jgi:hypothetical protein